MSLRERVERAQQGFVGVVAPPPVPPPVAGAPLTASGVAREAYLDDARLQIRAAVLKASASLRDLAGAEDARERISALIDRIVESSRLPMTGVERTSLVDEIVNDITGLGPLEPLLRDPSITEIMVNGPSRVYIERNGKLERVDVTFVNDEHVERIIDRIIAPIGRHIDDTSPRVDARLPDGSRVNAIIEPVSLIGPVITIRRFSATPFTVQDLIDFGTATPDMFEFLRCCIEAKLNLFVSGGTGSGKTTMLNVLSSFIPESERIITVEDAAELQLSQTHLITLEARPANSEGAGEVTIRDLLRNAMHMRPDRLIVGECRSGEALDMIQAMTTGNDGSLSTGHANSAIDMLRRLETMVLMTGYELPLRAIREQIVSAVDVIVHTARLKDGSRKIVGITEVYGIEDDEILTQDIFMFEQTATEDGKVQGVLKSTGARPLFMAQFKAMGIDLPPGEFGIPAEDQSSRIAVRTSKARFGGAIISGTSKHGPLIGLGRAVKAGGMVYVSGVGPLDPESGLVVLGGIREQTKQAMANLQARLESQGSSLAKVVWANWSIRESSEYDEFSEVWARFFPEEGPVGQGTVMSLAQRRAGFRIVLGVIAKA
jgi:pilus assembly protein CpaF